MTISWIYLIIIGIAVGLTGGLITRKGGFINWFIAMITALAGSLLGEYFLGTWGTTIADMAIFPAIISSIGLTAIVLLAVTMIQKYYA